MSKIEEIVDELFESPTWSIVRHYVYEICSCLTLTRSKSGAADAPVVARAIQALPKAPRRRRLTRRLAMKAALPIGYVPQFEIKGTVSEPPQPTPAAEEEAQGAQGGQRADMKPGDTGKDPAASAMRR